MNKILSDKIGLLDKEKNMTKVKGHVTIRDKQGNILLEKDNLVLFNTRIFLFEHLFKVGYIAGNNQPSKETYNIENHKRSLCLFTLGQGGADINSTPFNPFVPKFNDTGLYTPIFFKKVDTADISDDNPSILNTDIGYVQEGTYNDKQLYYREYFKCNADGSTADVLSEEAQITSYYAKRFDSYFWDVDDSTGEVSFVMNMSVKEDECRGQYINEIGLILAEFEEPVYDEVADCYRIEDVKQANEDTGYKGWELATRLTFDTESLTSLGKELEIEYRMYI